MTTQTNPADALAKAEPRKRISMSAPFRKLEVPDMPGYHLHWFVDSNVARAQQAGYEFVDAKEIVVNNFGVANGASVSGNASLGSQVQVVASRDMQAGGITPYLTLMKLKQEYFQEDQQALQAKNEAILSDIFSRDKQSGVDGSYLKQVDFKRGPRKMRS